MALYAQGIFNPQMADQAVMLLSMMEFEGKDELLQKISQNGTMMQQMAMYQQLALQLAAQVDPMLAEKLANDIMSGAAAAQSAQGGGRPAMPASNDGGMGGAMTKLGNARARAAQAAQP
jgi:Rod binding domain-containing protein